MLQLNYDMMLAQVREAFKHPVNLLSAVGLCTVLDCLAQEYYTNMKIRAEMGLAYPKGLTNEEIERVKAEYLRQRKPGVVGNKKMFLWAFENMVLELPDEVDPENPEEPKKVSFTPEEALILYDFRCAMLHNLGSERFNLINFPKNEDGSKSTDLEDYFDKPIIEPQGDKIGIRLKDLHQYLEQVTSRVLFRSLPFEDGNTGWVTLGQFISTHDELQGDEES